jgi:hypothetical protein
MSTVNLLNKIIERVRRGAEFDKMSGKLVYKRNFLVTLRKLGFYELDRRSKR